MEHSSQIVMNRIVSVVRNTGQDSVLRGWCIILDNGHHTTSISMTIEELDDLRTQLWPIVRDNQG